MPHGYFGRILRVDLSSGDISVDEQDDVWYRRYFGGAGVSAYYLLKEMPAGADPLGPDNRLIVAPGVITGAPVTGAARMGIGAKSPMSGGIGKSEVGGFFNSELKRAGYDGIVLQGQAEKPVYLWINDGVAELRDARHLWGLGVLETEEAIRAELGERMARIACIGPAGERLVRFACIVSDLKDSAGRSGVGAVMGSKRLKAIVARGKTPPSYADPEAVKVLGKMMAETGPVKAKGLHDFGTGSGMDAYNLAGNMPTRNFRDAWFDETDAISAPTVMKTLGLKMEGCYACAIRCKKVVKVDEPWVADPRYGGPEYETLGAFGSDCLVSDAKALARAHHLCQHYGMDSLAAGTGIAFAMECFERGYLTRSDLDGLELTWGNAEAMLKLLEMMGERQGIGDLLAEGATRAARKIGGGAEEVLMAAKGIDLAMHEPRLKPSMGLSFAAGNYGGDHSTGVHDTFFDKEGPSLNNQAKPLGILEAIPASELSNRKVHLFTQLLKWRSVTDTVCLCYFVPWSYDETTRLINAITGWNTSVEELMLLGERTLTMGRAFNTREGFTPADDRLPGRFFSPPARGPLAEKGQALDPQKFQEAIRSYYYMMGWDVETGVPTRITLERLGVGWVADELGKAGKLP